MASTAAGAGVPGGDPVPTHARWPGGGFHVPRCWRRYLNCRRPAGWNPPSG